ncbi:hypothetical protein DFH08DRAFT_804745 [Mycena albidolilacea]|uniref:Uncharacterized protein n=1 Tax=Mycena albidolilacea TaxID=1033008 RepID=A0AAD7A9Y6_9AGAR|nr:hypothetical protein DFH08DRAFT_804745 [Mycena albidolilacea]
MSKDNHRVRDSLSLGLRSVRLRRQPSRKQPFSSNERAYPSIYGIFSGALRTDPVYGRGDGRFDGWGMTIMVVVHPVARLEHGYKYPNTLERVQVTQFGNFVVNVYLRQFTGSEHCVYFGVKELAHCYIMLQLGVLGQRPPNGLWDLGTLYAYSEFVHNPHSSMCWQSGSTDRMETVAMDRRPVTDGNGLEPYLSPHTTDPPCKRAEPEQGPEEHGPAAKGKGQPKKSMTGKEGLSDSFSMKDLPVCGGGPDGWLWFFSRLFCSGQAKRVEGQPNAHPMEDLSKGQGNWTDQGLLHNRSGWEFSGLQDQDDKDPTKHRQALIRGPKEAEAVTPEHLCRPLSRCTQEEEEIYMQVMGELDAEDDTPDDGAIKIDDNEMWGH